MEKLGLSYSLLVLLVDTQYSEGDCPQVLCVAYLVFASGRLQGLWQICIQKIYVTMLALYNNSVK
jgi:hypothetical protein